jgi:hypothetical protein
MKVKDLIEQLKKQDPEKDVMIQQGEEFDYMLAHSVKVMELADEEEEENIEAVVIKYS